MALGTNHITGSGHTSGTADNFIPELWSDEIIASYKQSLVLANLVNKMPMKGKKGDTIHVPSPSRGSANFKNQSTQVTLNSPSVAELQILIDKHYEYSRLIEDITDVQALSSMRKFYTQDAGYQLARQVDNDLFNLMTDIDGGGEVDRSVWDAAEGGTADGSNFVMANKIFMSTATGAADYTVDTVVNNTHDLTDATIRDLIQQLDDADAPQNNRVLVLPPSAINSLRGIERYVSTDFVDNKAVMNGRIGQLYGVEVYVSTNCPVIEDSTNNNAGAGPDVKLGMLMQKEAFIMAEQMGVRTQSQYKQEWLADLMTADTIYGTKVYRPEGVVGIVVPA